MSILPPSFPPERRGKRRYFVNSVAESTSGRIASGRYAYAKQPAMNMAASGSSVNVPEESHFKAKESRKTMVLQGEIERMCCKNSQKHLLLGFFYFFFSFQATVLTRSTKISISFDKGEHIIL